MGMQWSGDLGRLETMVGVMDGEVSHWWIWYMVYNVYIFYCIYTYIISIQHTTIIYRYL